MFSIPTHAEPVFDEDGPFGPGEAVGPPATCETMPDWIERAPDYDGRISMAVEGPIISSEWDGALAYLIMCEPDEVQVMCMTYHPEEVTGEPVQFAGGFNRAGERQIVLDPCLNFPVNGTPRKGEDQ